MLSLSEKYEEVAIKYARKCIDERLVPSSIGWKEFAKSSITWNKSCPKNTFLELCKNGYIKGIPKGNYLSPKSKELIYIELALEILKCSEEIFTPITLWKKVLQKGNLPNIHHDYQMNVILALKSENLLNIT